MSSISSREFTVVVSKSVNYGSRTAQRIIINAEVMKSTKTCAGDLVMLKHANDALKEKAFSVGVAWPSLELSQGIALISSCLLFTAHLDEGATIRIFPLSTASGVDESQSLRDIREAAEIKLTEVSHPALPSSNVRRQQRALKRGDWMALLLKETLVNLAYITSSQVIDIDYESESYRFLVTSVSTTDSITELENDLQSLSLHSSRQIWRVGWDTTVSIAEQHAAYLGQISDRKAIADILGKTSTAEAYASVGGLDKQIAQIRDLLELPLTHPELFRHLNLKPPRGILLHGPPGTGKTHLARAIASSTSSAVLVVNGPELSSAYHGETEARLRDVFREAREKSPCIVILDEVDALVPKRDESLAGEVEKRVVATLLTILDGMEDGVTDPSAQAKRVVVIGTTNRPHAIDPALRRPGRFDREIEIGVPDVDARFAILSVLLSKTPHSITREELYSVAARTHGYVGADLNAVIREAGTLTIKRWQAQNISMHMGDVESSAGLALTFSDLIASLPIVRASAMRALFFESPPVHYSDIGGQDSVIQKLREAVEWPLLHSDVFKRLGVKPSKGILLYGPPGCSKTILVRACACESGVNFIAVKGPELLDKYLGESERAVREIFRKARAASPSILFFDEIDALAASRSAAEIDTMTVHQGVLASLLNEMDGVQELLGVTVVAATNRPDVIDPALIRPGRFDRLLYVAPPDQEAREEILRINIRKMSVESDIDVTKIAELTEGCSGSEIAALCKEAALFTMRTNMSATKISQEAFLAAAKETQRQISREMVQKFEKWRAAFQRVVT